MSERLCYYRCKKGHVQPHAQSFCFEELETGKIHLETGPLCPRCLVDCLRSLFGVEPVDAPEQPEPKGPS